MAYNLTKSNMIEHLKEDAEYFPFEQIRSFELLQGQPIAIAESVKQDYIAFFKTVKKECEHLLQTEKQSINCDLWKEAIKQIDKILK